MFDLQFPNPLGVCAALRYLHFGHRLPVNEDLHRCCQSRLAHPMEPVQENLLRNANGTDAVIWVLRINDISDREVFASLGSTQAGLKSKAPDFGIDLRPAQGSQII